MRYPPVLSAGILAAFLLPTGLAESQAGELLAVAGVLVEEGDRPAASGGESSGKWSWRGPGFRHALRNPGDKAVTVFETDIR